MSIIYNLYCYFYADVLKLVKIVLVFHSSPLR